MGFLKKSKKLSNFWKYISLSLALAVVVGNSPVFSQTTGSNEIEASLTLMSKIFDPPKEGAPQQTIGGATRGNCPTGDLASVIFERTDSGITARLPDGMANQVFFNLRNASNTTLYQGFIPVEENTASVTNNVLGEIDLNSQTYTWSMAIICGQALRPGSPVFQGEF